MSSSNRPTYSMVPWLGSSELGSHGWHMYRTVYVGADRALDSGLSRSDGISLGPTVRPSLPFHGIFLMKAQSDYHYVG
jgi:hypothetical protein